MVGKMYTEGMNGVTPPGLGATFRDPAILRRDGSWASSGRPRMANRKGILHSISTTSIILVLITFLGFSFLLSSPPPPSTSTKRAHPAHIKQAPPLHADHTTQTALQSHANGAFQRRVVVVGDIHGDLLHTTRLLRFLNLLNLKSEWIGGDTILVQTGGASG